MEFTASCGADEIHQCILERAIAHFETSDEN